MLRCAVVSTLAAISVLWNVDSGLFIVIAFGAYLTAQWAMHFFVRFDASERTGTLVQPQSFVLAIALHIFVVAIVLSLSFATIAFKSGKPLNLLSLFEYQRIFVELGLMMLPLPRTLHPWMSILAIYLVSLVASLENWRRRGSHVRADVNFFLSMLGLGLFVYYAGRAHVLNLVTVCWPAVVLAALGADDLLRGVRSKILPRTQLALPAITVALLLLAATSFVWRVPLLVKKSFEQFETRGRIEEPFVASELDLIRTHSAGKRECLILSQRQGIYYAESGLASPVKGPGIVEILLKSDQELMVKGLLQGHLDCVFLGVGGFTNAGLNIDMAKVLMNYEIKARNVPETLLYLQAKP